jgi:hypothetical protein
MSARPAVDVNVDTTGSTVSGRFTLKNLPTFDVTEAAKPLYAYVGALDLALAQAKEVPAQVRTIPAQVRTIPAQVKSLRGDVAARVEEVTEKATEVYTQLTIRGERLVTAIRRSPATEAAVDEGKEAVKQAQRSATAARNSAKAGSKAVEDAASKLG